MNYRKTKINNIDVYLIKTNKFKTTQISVKFSENLTEEFIPYRAILPYVLKSATKNFINKKEINKYLQNLYGASTSISVGKIGLVSTIDFSIRIVDNKYIDKNILDDAFFFLSDIIYNPLVSDDSFDDNIVELEKRLLIDEINNLKNNKIGYALRKMIEIMHKDELHRLSINGEVDTIKKINSKNLYNYYKSRFLNNNFSIHISGDLDLSDLRKYIKKYFVLSCNDNCENLILVDNQDKETNKFEYYEEIDNISQAKLNIGCRTNIKRDHKLYYAFFIGNAILGSYSHSKLFLNVREKEGLAYYIYSFYDQYKGTLIIYAGIDYNNLDKTIKIIKNQIEDIKVGNITEDELSITIKQIENDLLEQEDSQSSIIKSSYIKSLLKSNLDTKDLIRKINKVKIEDIKEAFNTLKEDTIFVLRGDSK